MDAVHQFFPEGAHHGGVNAGRHETEGVAGGHETVMRPQVFKPPLDDTDARQAFESGGKGRVQDPQVH